MGSSYIGVGLLQWVPSIYTMGSSYIGVGILKWVPSIYTMGSIYIGVGGPSTIYRSFNFLLTI